MTDNQRIMEILKTQLPLLKQRYSVRSVAVFGSYARKTENIESDVDLVIDFESPIGIRFMELSSYLEGLLGKSVDILTPHGVDSIRLRTVADNIKREMIYV